MVPTATTTLPVQLRGTASTSTTTKLMPTTTKPLLLSPKKTTSTTTMDASYSSLSPSSSTQEEEERNSMINEAKCPVNEKDLAIVGALTFFAGIISSGILLCVGKNVCKNSEDTFSATLETAK